MTRPVGEGKDTAQSILDLGWNPLIVHTVELKKREPTEILSEFKGLLLEGPPDWLVFTSPRGVHLTMDALKGQDQILSSIRSTKIVAIGPKTREAVVSRGYSDVLLPETYSSTGIASLFSKLSPRGERIVLARFADADDFLSDTLGSKGAVVKTLPLYSLIDPKDQSTLRVFVKALDENRIEGVLFTSSLSATNLFRIAGALIDSHRIGRLLQNCLVGAIGPVTARSLEEHGVRPQIVPAHHLIGEAVKMMIEAYRGME